MSETGPCAICKRSQGTFRFLPQQNPSVVRFDCLRCGVYDISHGFMTHGALDDDVLSEEARVRLSHTIRKATDAHGRFGENVLDFPTSERLAEQHPLPDPADQGDYLIHAIARQGGYGTSTPKDTAELWAARIGVAVGQQALDLAKELEPLIWMLQDVTTSRVSFKLSLEGWKQARELRRVRGPGNQAFVAMWFAKEMDAAFDGGFDPALRATGHAPYRVDRDNHNNKIDDQIVAQIRRSKLVIVDATGARPNAYYEAGFAAGLGIPVIWCCCDSPRAPGLTSGTWIDNLPFDIRQHAFTFWSDSTDLREKLTARIRALGFDAAWNRGQ